GVFQGKRMQAEYRLELLDRSAVGIQDIDAGYLVGLDEFAAAADSDVLLLEKFGRRVGDDLDADHRAANFAGRIKLLCVRPMRKLQMPPVPCGRRWTHEGRAPQRREGVEGGQEPLVSAHQSGQRRIAEVPRDRRRHSPGREHAGPRTPYGRVDVLHPRGPWRSDVGPGAESPRTRDRDLLPGGVDARNPKRRQGSASLPLMSRAAVRDRRPLSELAGARKPRHDWRLTTR